MITPKSALPDYIGPRSTVVFNILDIPTLSYNGLLTKDEESYQDLVLVVEAHRNKFNLLNKSDLKQLF